MCDLLWSDPQDMDGRSASKRGVGCQFGPDVTHKFCEANGLDYVVRYHFSSILMLIFWLSVIYLCVKITGQSFETFRVSLSLHFSLLYNLSRIFSNFPRLHFFL